MERESVPVEDAGPGRHAPHPRRGVFASIWRHPVYLLTPPLLLLGAAFLYDGARPSSFTATARLLIASRAEGGVVATGSVPSPRSADDIGGRTLLPDPVLARAIEDGDLAASVVTGRLPGWLDRLSSAWDSSVRTAAVDPAPSGDIVEILRKRLTLRRSADGGTTDLSATTASADLSARLANTVAEALVEEDNGRRDEEARRSAALMGARVNDARARVDAAVAKVGVARAGDPAEAVRVARQARRALLAQLASAKARLADARIRADRPANGTRVSSPVLDRSRAEVAALLRRRAQLARRFGPRHPAVAANEAAWRQARDRGEREASRLAARAAEAARADLMVAQSRAAGLERALSRATATFAGASQGAARLGELATALDVERARLATAEAASREAAVSDAAQAPSRIVSRATAPPGDSGPTLPMIAAAGLLLGLGIGCGLAVSRERIAGSGGEPDGSAVVLPERGLADVPPAMVDAPATMPVAGGDPLHVTLLPLSDTASFPVMSRLETALRPTSGGSASATGAAPGAVPALCDLAAGRTGGEKPRTIVLLASTEALDTATAALAFAVAACREQRPVLVVDANPGMHLTSRIRPTPRFGFADVMRGLVTLDEAAVRVQVGGDLIDVLASGNPPPPHVSVTAGDIRTRIVDARLGALVIVDGGKPDPTILAFVTASEATLVQVGSAGIAGAEAVTGEGAEGLPVAMILSVAPPSGAA